MFTFTTTTTQSSYALPALPARRPRSTRRSAATLRRGLSSLGLSSLGLSTLGLSTLALVLAAAATPALAQSSSSSSSSSSAIPTGISSTCTQFFTTLDSDADIKACTAPLLSATQYYTNATSGADQSQTETALKDSLAQLCGANAGCDSDLIRTKVSDFWNSCMTELQEQDKAVQNVYDVLYLINPFRQAICSQDGNGNYCLTQVASTNSSTSTSTSTTSTASRRALLPELHHRLRAVTQGEERAVEERTPAAVAAAAAPAPALAARADVDNATDAASAVDSFSGTNIAFLFLQPTADKSVICSTCAQNILASYIAFETSIPYCIGLANSDILAGQSDLYKAGKTTCGDDWARQVNQVAGTTDFAKVAAAPHAARPATRAVLAGVVAGLTAVIAAVF